MSTQPSVRDRRHERGSLLVACYFVVAVLLSLAIPQSMRALHYNQLVRINANQEAAFQAAEAARARALRVMLDGTNGNLNRLVSNPFFGEQDGTPAGMHTLGTNGAFQGIDSCQPGQGPSDWDCWPSVYQLSYAGATYNVSFRAQEIGSAPPIGGWVTKRIQFVVYQVPSITSTTPFTGQWLTTHEVKVRLRRSGEAAGLSVGTRLVVSAGNGIEDSIIKSQYVLGYGDAVASGGANIADLGPMTVLENQAIWGRVLLKDTPGFDLCCDSAAGVGLTDELVLTNAGNDARVRMFPADYSDYWRTITSSPGSMTALDYMTFTNNVPRVADRTGILNPIFPATSADRPDQLPAAMATYDPDEVMPQTLKEMNNGVDQCTRFINGPGGSGAKSVTLCAYYDAAGNALPAGSPYRQGVCSGTGEHSVNGGDHDVWRIGQVAADGVTVEYCAAAVDLGEGTELRVQGDKARLLLRGYKTSSDVHVAMDAGENSTIFAFKQSETAAVPVTDEYITGTYGNSAAGFTAFRNSLSDPNKLGHLSIEVLESNKYKRTATNQPWQRMPVGAAVEMTKVFNKPSSTSSQENLWMAPEVRIHGDIFLGTVNAPRSDVTLAADFMETRSTADPFVGFRMFWSGHTLLVTPKGINGPDPATNTSTPNQNELLGWRRCYTESCT